MVSTKKYGMLSLTVPSPMRFKKKPSAFNRCVGEELRGGSYATRGAVRSAFASAAKKCGR